MNNIFEDCSSVFFKFFSLHVTDFVCIIQVILDNTDRLHMLYNSNCF